MISLLIIIRPTVAGNVRKSAKRTALASVSRKCAISPPAAIFETAGNVTVATATPKIPSGNCIRRKAYESQLTAPSSRNDAKMLFTITLTCTALAAMTAGNISQSTRFTCSSRHPKSKWNVNPTFFRLGICTANCRNPPISVPMAMPINARGPNAGSISHAMVTPPKIEPRL